MLLIDHQSGLFQLVKDIDMLRLRHNVSALAKVSKLAKLPTHETLRSALDDRTLRDDFGRRCDA